MSIAVVVVDDSAVVRRVVVEALGGLATVHVAGEATNGREALELIDRVAPDAVVLDIEMPVMDGIETMRRLHRSHPRCPSSCSPPSPSAARGRPSRRWRPARATT